MSHKTHKCDTCDTCLSLKDELENIRDCLAESPDLLQTRDDVLAFVEALLSRFQNKNCSPNES